MIESAFVQVDQLSRATTISAGVLAGIKMQRDMEVIRQILRAVRDKKDLTPRILSIAGLDDFTVGYHVSLLHQAGYIAGPSISGGDVPFTRVLVSDLTWQGHDFAGVILAEDSVWEKIKRALGPEKLIQMPLKIVQDVATKELTAWAMSQLGTS
ncbi:hypothetical protein ACVME8_000143 [Bradyrhizobium diazoefficiens]